MASIFAFLRDLSLAPLLIPSVLVYHIVSQQNLNDRQLTVCTLWLLYSFADGRVHDLVEAVLRQ